MKYNIAYLENSCYLIKGTDSFPLNSEEEDKVDEVLSGYPLDSIKVQNLLERLWNGE